MNKVREPIDADTGALLLALMQACDAGCAHEEAYRNLMRRHVQPLIPHQQSVAVLAILSPGRMSIDRLVVTEDPIAHRQAGRTDLSLRERPILSRWLSTREPVIIDDSHAPDVLPLPMNAGQIDLVTGRRAMHGQIDISNRMATHFCLAGVSMTMTAETIRFRLRLITPHLHAAFMSLPRLQPTLRSTATLTALQHDLLAWLTAGRTNAEIATLRSRSPATVRNQLHTLYRKIGVSSRAEAVAFASRQPPFPHREGSRKDGTNVL